MTLRYSEDLPDPDDYHELFATTGWNELYGVGAQELVRGLGTSWHVVSAWEGDRLVGFGRLLSDGVLYAVVFDMIVAPERQGRGIGSEILRRLLARCDEAGIRDVLLFSARGKAGFYRRFDFVERPDDAPGMILRRRRPAGATTRGD